MGLTSCHRIARYIVDQALAQPEYCYHGSLEASFSVLQELDSIHVTYVLQFALK